MRNAFESQKHILCQPTYKILVKGKSLHLSAITIIKGVSAFTAVAAYIAVKIFSDFTQAHL